MMNTSVWCIYILFNIIMSDHNPVSENLCHPPINF